MRRLVLGILTLVASTTMIEAQAPPAAAPEPAVA
jgi:hypothetical protein